MTTHTPTRPAHDALGSEAGSTVDREQNRVALFCETHHPDVWPCPQSQDLALKRDEAQQRFYREREQYFARLFGVADAGKYRADWDGAVERWKTEQQRIGEERAIEVMRPEHSDIIPTIQLRLAREGRRGAREDLAVEQEGR